MTIKEFKRKHGLRQTAGSSVDEWECVKTGTYVSPCPVGFVVAHFAPKRGFIKRKVVRTLAAADKLLGGWK